MPTRDLRVNVVLDYTMSWDDDTYEPDIDQIHDIIVDALDAVDLEFSGEGTRYDEDDEEIEETEAINLNCDNVREVEVTDVTEGGRG